jgi:ribosomal subunit interface protein
METTQMQTPLQITFRNMEASDSVEARIRERAERLERFRDRITSCHVTIEASQRRANRAKMFQVRVDVAYPGGEVVVKREAHDDQNHEGFYQVLRDAFEAARRQLQDKTERQQGQVKSHLVPPHGVVDRLFADQGYGFVRMPDGQEVYFHRNAVVDGEFAELAVGEQVRCEIAEGEGIKGPQASTVRPVGNHRLPPVERVRVS